MAKIALDLEINTGSSVQSLSDVKRQLKELKDQMIAAGEGTAEFDALAQKAAELQDKVKQANEEIANMDPGQFQGLQRMAQGAATGVQLVTSSMALLGVESEDMQKAMMRVQAAMSFAQAINDVEKLGKGFDALTKFMMANPFLAIASALTALALAAKAVYDKFEELNSPVAQLTREYEKQKEVTASLTREYDREIELLTAQGASEEQIIAIKKKKIEAQIAEAEASVKLHFTKIQEIKDQDSLYEAYLRTNEQILRAAGATETADQIAQLIAAKKAERAKDEVDQAKEDLQTIADLKNQMLVIDAETERKQTETHRTESSNRAKIAQDEAAAKKKAWEDELTAFYQQGDDLYNTMVEQNAKQDELDRLANEKRLKGHADYLEAKKQAEQKAYELRKKQEEEEQKRREMVNNAAISAAANLFNSLGQLAGKNAKLQKGFAVAEATINTYKGVTAALAQPLPTPINFVNAAAVLAAGIANVRKILAQEASVSAGVNGGSAVGGGGMVSMNPINNQPQGVQPSTLLDQNGNVINQQNQQSQPNRVFVVESDITNSQNHVASIQNAMRY